jgi:Na+/H+ antiporter NhaA
MTESTSPTPPSMDDESVEPGTGDVTAETRQQPFLGRTTWRRLETPLRSFLRTETGSAVVLLAAILAALIWINVGSSSYTRVWQTVLSIHVGGRAISHTLQYWTTSGLMTLFFFVAGLEVRREFDIGELREWRRVTFPLAAGLGGMVAPIAIFLAFTLGHSSAGGWGVVMSTDTAFALGMLALVGSGLPDRLRVFLLTLSIVDDVVGLIVIATVYSSRLVLWPLLLAIGLFVAMLAASRVGVHRGFFYAAVGVAAWAALSASGIDPIVIGLAMGLLTSAAPAARGDLERASDLFRLFREQPTSALERTARLGLRSAVSPNERLQRLYHPWTSYLIVPLFALANAGIKISGGFLSSAFTSPITLGILIGSVVGKPIGVVGGSWLVTRLGRGRLRPPIGWVALTGGGAIAGIGFTVSLLIAGHAFHGTQLEEAKLGVLSAALCASLLTWMVFRVAALLPKRLRIRALLGTTQSIVDLAAAVDAERDHIRGLDDAPVTVVEYGDFQCPYCGQAEPVVRELLRDVGDLRYVWRHLPLYDVHPRAQLAAEAAEAAARQRAFWPMHDLLLDHQDALEPSDVIAYAEQLGLDLDRFTEDLDNHTGAAQIAEDVESADLSGVSGTPTFFVNGRRHHGAYDIDALTTAVRVARAVVAAS